MFFARSVISRLNSLSGTWGIEKIPRTRYGVRVPEFLYFGSSEPHPMNPMRWHWYRSLAHQVPDYKKTAPGTAMPDTAILPSTERYEVFSIAGVLLSAVRT